MRLGKYSVEVTKNKDGEYILHYYKKRSTLKDYKIVFTKIDTPNYIGERRHKLFVKVKDNFVSVIVKEGFSLIIHMVRENFTSRILKYEIIKIEEYEDIFGQKKYFAMLKKTTKRS